ncbi:MAG: ferritin-like domain-containing protein [Chloroflexi bacterium]|nr:ferritin-like domain-containing protein [Chloroflexota bacterium]
MAYGLKSSSEMTEEQHSNKSSHKPATRRKFLFNSLASATVIVPATLLATQTAQAATKAACKTSAYRIFNEIKSDEDAHVSFLYEALGKFARPKPTFQSLKQRDLDTFVRLSQTIENIGVGAYLMAAPAISNKGYLSAAGSILTIEARHAGYLNSLVNLPLSTNGSFDKPISQAQVVQDVMPFITSLNGGPDPAKPLKSDIDILNFALLLEFLEATFYDINVPHFYG